MYSRDHAAIWRRSDSLQMSDMKLMPVKIQVEVTTPACLATYLSALILGDQWACAKEYPFYAYLSPFKITRNREVRASRPVLGTLS